MRRSAATPVTHDRRAHPSPGAGPRLPVWARVLLTVVGVFLALLPAAGASLVPALRDPDLTTDPWAATAALAVVSGLTLVGFLGVARALARGVDRQGPTLLRLRVDRRAGVALGAGLTLSAVAVLAVSAAGRALGAPGADPPDYAAAPAAVAVLVVLLRSFVLQGIGEEVLFRGYLLHSLAARPRRAVLISALAFTLPHLLSQAGQESMLERLAYLAVPFGFGLSAGVLTLLSGSTWAGIGVHAGQHVAIAVAEQVGLGASGPAVWLGVGGVHLVAALVMARRPLRPLRPPPLDVPDPRTARGRGRGH